MLHGASHLESGSESWSHEFFEFRTRSLHKFSTLPLGHRFDKRNPPRHERLREANRPRLMEAVIPGGKR